MPADLVSELRNLLGDGGVLDAAELSKRSAGTYRFDTLKAAVLVRPNSTQQVSDVMRWCHAHGASVVTHGGLTGLVHGADAGPSGVILSLERMRTIEEIDVRQRVAVVQAGVPLQALVDKFSHVRFEPSGWTTNPDIRYAHSILDYIFRWLGKKFLSEEELVGTPAAVNQTADLQTLPMTENQPQQTLPFKTVSIDAPTCGECGGMMTRNGSCFKCENCGGTSGCS